MRFDDARSRVFCIVPVFNRISATLHCISCLRAQTFSPLTIVVVDGGSTDGTQQRLRVEHPDVVLLEGRGLWWGGATRRGIDWTLNHSTSDSDFVMLVNNDTAFDRFYVEKLAEHSRCHNAAMSGLVLDTNSPARILHAGIQLDWSTYSLIRVREIPAGQKIKLDCCMLPGRGTLIPIHAVRAAGNVDDKRFPHYLSDFEFTYRVATKGGIRLGVAYDAIIQTPPDEATATQDERPLAQTLRALRLSLSKRKKGNLLGHYRFISRHAPQSEQRRLKLILLRRHWKRIVSPMARTTLVEYCRRGGALVFGSYLITDSDIDKHGLDRSRLEVHKILSRSRHDGYFYPSRPRKYVQQHYPEALALYKRAGHPLRKLARFAMSRLQHVSAVLAPERIRKLSPLAGWPLKPVVALKPSITAAVLATCLGWHQP